MEEKRVKTAVELLIEVIKHDQDVMALSKSDWQDIFDIALKNERDQFDKLKDFDEWKEWKNR